MDVQNVNYISSIDQDISRVSEANQWDIMVNIIRKFKVIFLFLFLLFYLLFQKLINNSWR